MQTNSDGFHSGRKHTDLLKTQRILDNAELSTGDKKWVRRKIDTEMRELGHIVDSTLKQVRY